MILKNSNKLLKYNGSLLNIKEKDPYNPLDLPPYTMRLVFKNGYTPQFHKGTGVQVKTRPNIWDLTYENTDWGNMLDGDIWLLEVMGANTTGVTNMNDMFFDCSAFSSTCIFDTSNVTSTRDMFMSCRSLTSAPLFDTSNVTDMHWMFAGCTSLNSVPLLDTSNVTDMGGTFGQCWSVQSGALALYQQASSQTNPPTNHNGTFGNCGRDTQTGSAELAQIPQSWGGTKT